MTRSTVAIIGSNTKTIGRFDWDRDDVDVWVFNEATKSTWCKRADAVFQMHKPVVWRSSANRNDPKHYEWLKSTTTPVYMLEQYEDVKASVKFPLDEILADIYGSQQQIPYFTSSVAYALGLAIYKRYKRIEVYGVEMETGTEYAYQRTGVAFLVGIAVGRGIEVAFHSDTFFNMPLYGYEGDVKIDKSRFEERVKETGGLIEYSRQKLLDARALVEMVVNAYVADKAKGLPDIDNLIARVGQTAQSFGLMDGTMQQDQYYLDKCLTMEKETGSYLIVMQEYESNAQIAESNYQQAMLKVYDVAKYMKHARDKLLGAGGKYDRKVAGDEFMQVLDKYQKVSTEVGMATGIGMENKQWMTVLKDIITAAGGVKAQEIMMEEVAQVG